MRALLNVYYCLDDTTLSCLLCVKTKTTEKGTKRGRAKGSTQHDDGVLFPFLMYTYMRTLFSLLPWFRCWAWRNAHLRGDGFPGMKNRGRFFVASLAAGAAVLRWLGSCPGGNTLYILHS